MKIPKVFAEIPKVFAEIPKVFTETPCVYDENARSFHWKGRDFRKKARSIQWKCKGKSPNLLGDDDSRRRLESPTVGCKHDAGKRRLPVRRRETSSPSKLGWKVAYAKVWDARV